MVRQILKEADLPPGVLLEAEATLKYLPLTGGTLTGNLTVDPTTGEGAVLINTAGSGTANVIFKNAGVNRQALIANQFYMIGHDYQRGTSWLTYYNGDAVPGAGYLSLNPNGRLDVTAVSTFNGAVSTGALTAPTAAITTSATVAGKAIAASPDSGNALEFRTNGFYSGGGGGGSFSSIRDEEFAPAAAATTVVLAATPVNIVMVSRNGVVQSQAAGNFSLAGSTLTFTDAFVAGERVAVVYEIGVAAGDLAYTKNDSDLRFVNVAGDVMTGTLQVNANVGVGVAPAAWGSAHRALQVGYATTLFANLAGTGGGLIDNSYYDGTGFKAIGGSNPASHLTLSGGLTYATAPTVAAGAAQTFTTRLTVGVEGNSFFGPPTWHSLPAIVASVNGATEAEMVTFDSMDITWSAGLVINDNQWTSADTDRGPIIGFGTNKKFGNPSPKTFLWASIKASDRNPAGNPAGHLSFWTNSGADNRQHKHMEINDRGTVTVTPDAGQPSLSVGGRIVGAAGNLQVGAHDTVIDTYLRGNNLYFRTLPAGAFVPEIDNQTPFGAPSLRLAVIYAANGTIQTCRAAEKDILGLVDPGWALEAVVNTPVKLYHPKDDKGVADETLTFAGIVDDSADHRMQIGEGSLTSPSHQAALLMAAIQALSSQLDELRARLA